MLTRWIPGFTLFIALVGVPAVQAGGKAETAPPTVVVRVRSLDTLIQHAKLVVALAGREEVARQVEGLVKSKVGAKGLEGIDTTRPIGAYAHIGKDLEEIITVVMVPIADEAAFLALLENLNFKATKGQNDIYTVQTGTPVDAYFRFANKYAYATALNLNALDKNKLLEPGQIFAGKLPALSASVRIDQLPTQAKLIGMYQVEQELTNLQQKKEPNETETQRQLRVAILKEMVKLVSDVLKDGTDLAMAMDITGPGGELTLDLSLSAKPGSALAGTFEGVGKSQSLFAGLKPADAAAGLRLHLAVPESLKKAYQDVVDEGLAKGANLEQIRDPARKQQAEQLLKVVAPTLKAGILDAAAFQIGPTKNNHYTLIGALRVEDGDALAKTLRSLADDLLKEAPPAERAKVKLDFESVGPVKIHRIDIQEKFDRKAREILGDYPVYLAFRSDALFVSAGEEGLPVLKILVAEKGQGAGPVLAFDAAVARLTRLMARTEQHVEQISKFFPGNDQGQIRFRVEGGPSLRLAFSAQLSIVPFFREALTVQNLGGPKSILLRPND